MRWQVLLFAGLLAGCLETAGSADEPSNFGDADEVDATGDASLNDSAVDSASSDDTKLVDTGAIDSSPGDSGALDTGPLDTGPLDTGTPDTPPPCDESKCGVVPGGAKHYGLVDRSTPCPAGYTQTDVVEASGTDGCTCSCAIGAKPTCPGNGTIPTAYGGTATCGSTGSLLTSAGTDVCANLGFTGSLDKFFKGTPPAPLGGTCTVTPKTDKPAVTRNRRLCEPKAGTCAAPICNTPFVECVETTGACPTGFPNARTVGSDFVLTCPACTCGVTASCSGTLTLYKDADCKGPTTALAVDGSCVTAADGTNVSSFKYAPKPAVASCSTSFTTAPGTRSFIAARQLCCR